MENGLKLAYFNAFSICILLSNSHFKSVIFIGPFRISTDNYHAVDDSALCACEEVWIRPLINGGDPFLFQNIWTYVT